MDDNELHTLKNITPPPPSTEAKQRAIANACDVFDASEKKFQGLSPFTRLIHSFNEQLWSFIMKKQLIAGTAIATVLAITITTMVWEPPVTQSTDVETNREDPSPSVIAQPRSQQNTASKEPKKRLEIAESEVAGNEFQEEMNLSRADLSLHNAPSKTLDIKKEAPSARHRQATAPLAAQMQAKIVSGDSYIQPIVEYKGNDKFESTTPNPVKKVLDEPVSTFSVDVDTASYAVMRRALNSGNLPHKDSVRVEELINYFDYDYALPESAEQPFKPTVSVYPTPWNEHTKLLHIGIKGHDIVPTEKPKSNMVFLLDVSGSMNSADKLPLLKNAFRMMVDNMQPDDLVSIVTYAGHAGTALEPTPVRDKAEIFAALDRLKSGGGTAGAQGIQQAYALAEQNFDQDGVNRVILATDGDFNIGITNHEELKTFIEKKRESGIFLSVIGFGQGNYNDHLMQILAQNGNGNASYIDTLSEARKVLVDEASSTLFPIAKDVKIQIEFNPEMVSEYRLIGYETRMLKREDFNNDTIDAGDIGSGHTVTALYEITPVGSKAQLVDDLRYQKAERVAEPTTGSDEYAFLKLRYKLPDENESKLIELPIDHRFEQGDILETSEDIRFAAGVAAFGQILKNSQYVDFSYDDVIALAQGARGQDEFGYRIEFINLVRLAKSAR